MTQALTYVEIDVPTFSADSPVFTEETFRFAIDVDYLPNDIAAIPSITNISIQPAIISLGQNLGTRNVVTIEFRDHRHIFAGEDFTAGSFWGKFRARYGQALAGKNLRLIRGTLGQALTAMETRYYIIDATDGPSIDGIYRIVAKDVLTLTIAAKAQAPELSNGALVANITNVAASLTVTPTGIGAEYPS